MNWNHRKNSLAGEASSFRISISLSAGSSWQLRLELCITGEAGLLPPKQESFFFLFLFFLPLLVSSLG